MGNGTCGYAAAVVLPLFSVACLLRFLLSDCAIFRNPDKGPPGSPTLLTSVVIVTSPTIANDDSKAYHRPRLVRKAQQRQKNLLRLLQGHQSFGYRKT